MTGFNESRNKYHNFYKNIFLVSIYIMENVCKITLKVIIKDVFNCVPHFSQNAHIKLAVGCTICWKSLLWTVEFWTAEAWYNHIWFHQMFMYVGIEFMSRFTCQNSSEACCVVPLFGKISPSLRLRWEDTTLIFVIGMMIRFTYSQRCTGIKVQNAIGQIKKGCTGYNLW